MKEVWKPRTSEEMRRLEGLAKAAVGFDEKRGDEVAMENVSFSSNVPEAKSAGPAQMLEQAKGLLNAQPGMMKLVVTGACWAARGVLFVAAKHVANQVVVTLRGAGDDCPTSQTTVTKEAGGASSEDGADAKRTVSSDARARTWIGESALPTQVRETTCMTADQPGARMRSMYEQVAEHIKAFSESRAHGFWIEAWISPDAGPENNGRQQRLFR